MKYQESGGIRVLRARGKNTISEIWQSENSRSLWNPESASPFGATTDPDPLDIRRALRYTANAPTDETTEYVLEVSVA